MIKVLLADDHSIVREGLMLILAEQSDIEVVAQAQDGKEAVSLALEKRPDVIVMDITMPELNGIDATKKIVENDSNVKVIALSMHHRKQFVVDMLKAGISGYVVKSDIASDLIRAIRTVISGGTYLSPKIARAIVDDYIDNPNPDPKINSTLAPREREVLQLLSEGKTTKEIALVLDLSAKTIEATRLRIMNKLEIYDIASLTKYAINEGLTNLEF